MAELPTLGVGISYREPWRREILRHRDRLDVVEFIAEDVLSPAARRRLERYREAVPVLLHGIGLSLGGARGLDPARVEAVARLVHAVEPPWYSEHIAFTRAGEIEIGHLAPLPFTAEAVDAVARNVGQLRRAIPDLPVLLENIAYTVPLPGAEMSEAEFVRAVLEACDGFLLLDLENVHANALNHGYDAIEYLESLPLERVVEVHLAGGMWRDDTYTDSHSRPVPDEAWKLLEWLAARVPIRAVVIERDADLPPFEDLLGEVARARRILERRGAGVPDPGLAGGHSPWPV